MSTRKISIKVSNISRPGKSKPKQEPLMFKIIEKFLKFFFQLASSLPSRDKAELLRFLILTLALLCAFYLGAR